MLKVELGETRVAVFRTCLYPKLLFIGPLHQLGTKTSKEMTWYANCFLPFFEKLAFAHGVDFWVLACFDLQVDFLPHQTITCNMFEDHLNQSEKVWTLDASICKFRLNWCGMLIKMVSHVWAKTKWNWLMHFASILGHLFFAMSLIELKNNQVKRVCVLEMATCQSRGHDMIFGHGMHVGPAWPIAKLNPLLNELGLGP